jgi:hypothetical protein
MGEEEEEIGGKEGGIELVDEENAFGGKMDATAMTFLQQCRQRWAIFIEEKGEFGLHYLGWGQSGGENKANPLSPPKHLFYILPFFDCC